MIGRGPEAEPAGVGTGRRGNRLTWEPAGGTRRPAGMSKPARSRVPRISLAVLAVTVLALALVGCGSPVASLLPESSGPLVTVTTRGGECMDGPCGSVVVIERDGTVHTDDEVAGPIGTVPQGTLTVLDAAIKTTDFKVVRAVPFEGECPVNFDGQEWVYEFGAPGGVERIASCETAVDPAHPVFAALDAALVAVEVIPAP
jgi:hypothetical protein